MLLRAVTRDSSQSNGDFDSAIIQRRLTITEVLGISGNEPSVPIDVNTYDTVEDQDNEISQCSPEITAEEFNDLFPGHIELVYDRTSSNTTRQQCKAKHRAQWSGTTAKQGTSFLDLPRELRDQIYEYALASGKIGNLEQNRRDRTRVRMQPPSLFYAMPVFSQELLEMHYRCSTLRFAAANNQSRDLLLDWFQRHRLATMKDIHCVNIEHRMNFDGHGTATGFRYITTTIGKSPDPGLNIQTTHTRSLSECRCGIAELVRERLLRDDAVAGADWIHRIEQSTEFGPVPGFALQLLEAVRLAQNHERIIMNLSYLRRIEAHKRMSKNCTMCGKWRCCLQY